MAAPYIPRTDSGIADWGDNFAALITATPAAFGLTAPDAVVIQTAADDYRAAYTLAVNPPTRTPPNVAAKDAARDSAVATFRTFAMIIKANPAVTDMQLASLGLNVDDPTPTPIPAPVTSPILTIIAATPLQHTLRFADQATPSLRAKPFGAKSIEVHVGTATAPIVNPLLCDFFGDFTKQPIAVNYDPADVGKSGTIFARWKTATGLVGPWSLGVSMTVAADGGL